MNRWTDHALKNLIEREVDRTEAQRAIDEPTYVVPDPPDREIRMRRYFDAELDQEMLLRVVVEMDGEDLVVVTLYKTSQIDRYLKGL
jgi:hypothetical protein